MQTGWDDSHVEQTRLIGLRAPLPNDKPSLLGNFLNKLNPFNKKPDTETLKSINIICDTLQIVSHKESIKRLIKISNYKDFIKDTYFDVYFREEDFTIDETPEESLNNLIETLRYIVKDNKYREYIRNKYKLDDSSSKEQIYKKLIEHLQKIKSSKLTIDERDKILEQSGGNNKQYKEILGKRRRIYKIKGSRKDHVKYKGELIPVSDYKKLVKK